MGFLTVDESTYMPINGFTTVDLGYERGNNAYYPVQKTDSHENSRYFLKLFEEIWNDKTRLQDVTDLVLDSISTAYRENSPDFIYFFTLYNIFNEFLDDISEDVLPNEATGFKQSKIWNLLYNFQKDAALAIITNWKSTTAAFWQTALAWARPSQPWRSSNTTKTATNLSWSCAPRNCPRTGTPIKGTILTTQSPRSPTV